MSSTDDAGEVDRQPATVTEFAVEQGTLDGNDPGVQESIDADRKRAEEHTERARELSERLSEDSAGVPDNSPADDEDDDQG